MGIKLDLTKENEAAQDNALLNVLAAACVTEGWAVFVHNNGETIDILAGEVTAELREKISAALRSAKITKPIQKEGDASSQ